MTGTPTLWRRIKIFQADLNIRLSLRYGDPTAWHWWLAVKLKILRNYPFASQRRSKLLLIVLPTVDELSLHVYREDNSSFCIYLYVILLSPPSLDLPMRSIIWYYSSTCIYWRIFQLKSRQNFIVIIAGLRSLLVYLALSCDHCDNPLEWPMATIIQRQFLYQNIASKHGLPELYK